MNDSKTSLKDALEDRILTGEIRPGERLDEVALAQQFNVSRTPVRQALFALAATGLVEHIPRRGAFAAEVGPQQLSEMFEVIAELEALCARNCARRATCEDVAELTQLHRVCSLAARSGDSDDYYYANEKFHAAIRTIGGNRFLHAEVDRLQKRLSAYRRLQLRTLDRIASSLGEHETIVNAIQAGDSAAAAAAMRGHVSIQGERFADLLATLSRGFSGTAA